MGYRGRSLIVALAAGAAVFAISPASAATGSGAISAGGLSTCAVTYQGRLECWGDDTYRQTSGPNASTETFSQVSVGYDTVCGLKTDGHIRCWGNDYSGQDDVTRANASTDTFTQVSVGLPDDQKEGNYICAIKTDGHLECWGDQSNSKEISASSSPSTFTQISTGTYDLCGVQTGGHLECWGSDSYGQATGPKGSTSSYSQVAVGLFYTCALTTAGKIDCWGRDDYGDERGPLLSAPSDTFSGLSVSPYETCGLKTSGHMECWGTDNNSDVSGPNGSSASFFQIAAGYDHTCGLETTGRLLCWGDDNNSGMVTGPNASTDLFGQLDATPPVIAHTVLGAPGSNGWYTSDVKVTWTVTDPDSTWSIDSGCGVKTFGETAGATSSCTAHSLGGSATDSLLLEIDETKPVVSYDGNAGSYTVDQDVSITCSATDTLSGIASNGCRDITGPAYTFALGPNRFSARATDYAGNTFIAGTMFTVTVTADSLGTLVQRLSADAGVADALSAKLDAAAAAKARGQVKTEQNVLAAFRNQLEAQSGKALAPDSVDLIERLAAGL